MPVDLWELKIIFKADGLEMDEIERRANAAIDAVDPPDESGDVQSDDGCRLEVASLMRYVDENDPTS